MKKINTILNRLIVFMPVVLMVASCARINSPSGGPKDVTPPVILKSVPENGSKHFSGKSFTVTFDEFVALDKINDKFMVSPPLKKMPDISLKGKSLVVKWDDDLADSTTYTFYFQDAIRDNNEGNILNNYNYCFSTGDVIDSLSMTGDVFNASDLEATPDMLVMLYSNLADTAPQKIVPTYIARPDFSGGFTIKNIRPGSYRLYALNDLNGNKMFDGGDEKFAFCDSVINITPSGFFGMTLDSVRREVKTDETGNKGKQAVPAAKKAKPDVFTFGRYKLYSFTEEQKKQYLTSSDRSAAGSLSFTLALPADTSKFKFSISGVSDSAWYMESNADRDTFRIWITDQAAYGQAFLNTLVTYPYTDTTNTLVYKTDTVKMWFATKQPTLRSGKTKKQMLPLQYNASSVVKPGTAIWFKAVTPLNMPDTAKLILVQTIDSVNTVLKPVFVRDERDSRRIFLKNKLKVGASYSLTGKRGAFSDIYNVNSDSIASKFRVATAEEYGKVIANITGYKGKLIVQILNEKEDIIRQQIIDSPAKAEFGLLDKGKYRLKAVYDLDGNGRFTTGSYLLKRQPEPVTYYPGQLDVLVNWEIEQTWDISQPEKKDLSLRNKPEAKSKK